MVAVRMGPADTQNEIMKPTYREDKATQAAALFLKLRGNGNKMSHLKLMKLLYIAEREALLQWRRPITFDCYVSMPQGPVLSQTLNVINGESDDNGPWGKFISSPENHEVTLIEDPGTGSLSEAEERLIRDVFSRYGSMSRWEIRDLTHDFPEWQDPKGSSIPIDIKDILRGAGKTEIEIESIVDEIENIAMMDSYMGQ